MRASLELIEKVKSSNLVSVCQMGSIKCPDLFIVYCENVVKRIPMENKNVICFSDRIILIKNDYYFGYVERAEIADVIVIYRFSPEKDLLEETKNFLTTKTFLDDDRYIKNLIIESTDDNKITAKCVSSIITYSAEISI